jgi:hypothetical protein
LRAFFLTESVRLSEVTRIIVGEGSAANSLAQTSGGDAVVWAAEAAAADEPPGSSASLARDLVHFETAALDRRPDAIVLADDSDTALAAGLVAAKLLIPLQATEAARTPSSANGRLIEQLADAYTRTP